MDEQQARQLLGVDTGPVSLPDLREARNNALKAHHPDKVGSDPAAVRRSTYWTAQINVAYELLEPLAEGGKPINPTSADRNGPQRQSFAAAARRAQERVAAQERAAAMAGRRSSAQSNSRPQYRGDWRVLATELVGLVAGDDVTVLVDHGTLRIMMADTVAHEVPITEVAWSGSTSEVRLDLPDRQTVLLDWWDGDDGHHLRSALLQDTTDTEVGPTPRATTPVLAATARAGLVGYRSLAIFAFVALGIALLSQLHFAPSTPGHPGAAYFGDTAPIAAEPSPSMVCMRTWFDSSGNLRNTYVPCGQPKPGPDSCYRVFRTYPATGATTYMADPRPGTYSSEEDLKYFATRSPGNCPDL